MVKKADGGRVSQRRRRWPWLLCAAVACAGALGLGLYPHEPARRLAERLLKSYGGPDAKLGALHLAPLLLRAEARDLHLVGDGFELNLARVRVRLSPRVLWGAGLALDEILVDAPRLRLWGSQKAGRGTAPLVALPPVRHIELTDGQVAFDSGAERVFVLEGLAARGAIGEGRLHVEADRGRVFDFPLTTVRAELALSPSLALSISDVEIAGPGTRLGARGRIAPNRKGWQVEIEGNAAVDLSVLPYTKDSAHGMVSITTRVTPGADGASHAVATLGGRNLEVAQVPVSRLDGRIEHVATDRTEAHVTADLLSGNVTLDARLLKGDLTATLGLERVALAPLAALVSGRPSPVKGDASGSVTARGPVDSAILLEGHLVAEARGAALDSANVTLTVAGEARPRQRRLGLQWSAGLEGRGRSLLRQVDLALRGDVAAGPNLRLSADGSGRARLALPTGEAVATGVVALRHTSEASEGQVGIAFLGGQVAAGARRRGARWETIAIEGRDLDLSRLAPDLKGRAAFSAEAHGEARHLVHRSQLTVSGGAWREAELGTLSAAAQGVAREVKVQAQAPALGLTAEAALTGRRERVDVVLRFADTPLRPLGLIARRPFEGHLRGELEASIPWRNPERASGTLQLQALEIRGGEIQARLAAPLVARLEQQLVTIADLRVDGPSFAVRASGQIATRADRSSALKLEASADLGQAVVIPGWTLAGRLAAAAEIGGTWSAPQILGKGAIHELQLAPKDGPAITAAALGIQFLGERLRVESEGARLADGSLQLEASAPWTVLRGLESDSTPAVVELRWTDLDLAQAFGPLSGAPQPGGISGRVSGQLHVAAPSLKPATLVATLDTPSTTFSVQGTEVQVEPLRLRLERGVATLAPLDIRSSAGTLTLAGSAALADERLALRGKGAVDLSALSAFLTDVGLAGRGDADVDVAGTFAAPTVRGTLIVSEASIRTRDLPQQLTDLSARVAFDEREVGLGSLTAHMGGGTVEANGTARLAGRGLGRIDLNLTGKGIALSYPEGLRSQLDAKLTLTGDPRELLLAGEVRATSGLYSLNLATEQTLLAPLPPPLVSPLLRSVRLKLDLKTERPIHVRNDIARLDATGKLELGGDLEAPQPSGSLDVVTPGGRLLFQGHEFLIEDGHLSYEGTWEPVFTLTGTTHLRVTDQDRTYDTIVRAEAHGSRVELMQAWAARLGGSAEPNLDQVLSVTNDSNLSQNDLVSYLSTGRARAELQGQELRALGENAAMLLATRLSSGLGGLGALGLDEVSIQPDLIARERDPGARFTFGKRLSPYARLVYSRGLGSAESSFFELTGEPGLGAALSLRRQDDGRFVYGAGQRLKLGPHRRRGAGARDERVKIAGVRIEGVGPAWRDLFGAKTHDLLGKRIALWALQDRAEKLRRQLVRERFLSALVSADLSGETAVFSVRPGARYRITVSGMDRPPDLLHELGELLYEDEARQRGKRLLLRDLREHGHFAARVEMAATSSPATFTGDPIEERTLSFEVQPGPHLAGWQVSFPGARLLSENELLKRAGGIDALLVDEEAALARIRGAYEERFYLSVRIAPPLRRTVADRFELEVAIDEGAPARLTAIGFQGSSLAESQLREWAGLSAGVPPTNAQLLAAAARLRENYQALGYNSCRIDPRFERVQGDLALTFRVAEGERRTIGRIEIQGASGALERQVRRTAGLAAGGALDPRALSRVERRLRDLRAVAGASVRVGEDNPATVTIQITPATAAEVGYDLRYDDQDHLTGLVDGEIRNVLGLFALGGRYRVGAAVREQRASLQTSVLGGRGLTLSAFQLDEDLDSSPVPPTRLQQGLQAQQTWRLPDRWNLLAGYRFKRVTVTSFAPINVAAVELSLLRDTRDNALDPTRGRFWSVNLEAAEPRLGSSTSFIKGFGQLFLARPLRTHWVWAQGFRLGLAQVFRDEPLISFERFTAGGGNSVRGYATDSLGPLGPLGTPSGGQCVIVLNQELRYRHRTGLGAAVFYDAGNVFALVRDARLSLRHSVGVGLRYASPVGLIRLDVGFPIGVHPGERRIQRFLSLGQAF